MPPSVLLAALSFLFICFYLTWYPIQLLSQTVLRCPIMRNMTVASSSISKKKRETTENSKENRINSLPELVLHHILGFLDMKEVLQSSFISKRWRFLWTSVPTLNFDYNLWSKVIVARLYCKKITRKGECMDFVDRVLFSRDNFAAIQKINLAYTDFWDIGRVRSWLICVIKRHVKEVSIRILSFTKYGTPTLPELLFTSEIEALNLSSNYQLPESMCSSRTLRTLFLDGTRLPSGGPDGKLKFSFPVLEELVLSGCIFGNLTALDASSTRLKKFVLRWTNRSVLIRLCAPNLIFFECTNCSSVRFSLENLSSVVAATLDTTNPSLLYHVRNVMRNIRTISLSVGSKVPQEALVMWDQLFTTLANLRSIEMISLGSSSCLRALKSSPHIEYIAFDNIEDEDCDLELSEDHVFHHLKYVKVKSFRRSLEELKFFAFLLKNAVNLESITAFPNPYEVPRREEYRSYWEKIQSLPRSSSKAKLQFKETYIQS